MFMRIQRKRLASGEEGLYASLVRCDWVDGRPRQTTVAYLGRVDEEQAQLTAQRQKAEQLINSLPNEPLFEQACANCGILNGTVNQDFLYERYEDFTDLLTIAQVKNPSVTSALPPQLRADVTANARQLTLKTIERACQLVTDCPEVFGEASRALEYKLKSASLIQRGKVSLNSSALAEKTLISSMGKLKSIADIAAAENQNLGEKLRMLVLTDFIGQAHMNAIGANEPMT